MRASKTWRRAHRTFKELKRDRDEKREREKKEPQVRKYDLDPHASVFIMVDTLDHEAKNVDDRWGNARSFNALISAFTRFLSATRPCISFRTGRCTRETLGDMEDAINSLAPALRATQAGTPVIFLDVRERTLLPSSPPLTLPLLPHLPW